MVVNEKPILFKPELVSAILNKTKTETRRIIKPQPFMNGDMLQFPNKDFEALPELLDGVTYDSEVKGYNMLLEEIGCKYRIGMELWVRETWAKPNNIYPHSLLGIETVFYKASIDKTPDVKIDKWKPSIHMPKKYCRLRLLIRDIWVEKLQDISESDAQAEGVIGVALEDIEEGGYGSVEMNARKGFKILWDKINAKRGFPWESDPWLWCLKFEVV